MDLDNKIISVKEALDLVKSGDHVFTGLGAGEAKLFLENLHTIADKVNNVTITNSLTLIQPKFYEDQYKDSFNIDSMFFSPVTRSAYKNGNISYVPNHLYLSASDRMKRSISNPIFLLVRQHRLINMALCHYLYPMFVKHSL